MNYVYLVKRQIFHDNDSIGWTEDIIVDICATLEAAQMYIDMPNFDIIITRYTLGGGPDSEILMENISTTGRKS